MYLYEIGNHVPTLKLRADEPRQLYAWAMNIPHVSMSRIWELDQAKGQLWYDHLHEKIVAPFYGNAVLDANNELVPGAVNSQSWIASSRKFNDWMGSSANPNLFSTVPLKRFKEEGFAYGAMYLLPDVYCEACDHEEPAFIYMGTSNNGSIVHPSYAGMINNALEHPIFDTYLDVASCFSCDPANHYITPMMERLARRRPGVCECMPCRGRL